MSQHAFMHCRSSVLPQSSSTYPPRTTPPATATGASDAVRGSPPTTLRRPDRRCRQRVQHALRATGNTSPKPECGGQWQYSAPVCCSIPISKSWSECHSTYRPPSASPSVQIYYPSAPTQPPPRPHPKAETIPGMTPGWARCNTCHRHQVI